jgi:hypothetical protein
VPRAPKARLARWNRGNAQAQAPPPAAAEPIGVGKAKFWPSDSVRFQALLLVKGETPILGNFDRHIECNDFAI